MAWPTTSNPRTEFVTLRLTADEAADLDAAVAAGLAKNRSDYVREAVKARLDREERRAAKKQKKAAK